MSVNTNKTEKDKALEAAMAQIQKQFGKPAWIIIGHKSVAEAVERSIKLRW